MSSEEIARQGSIRLPQPDEIPEREKEDAMAAYLMMFASLAIGLPIPLFNLIASFVYYLVNRKTSRFVAFHALQSLLSHIPIVLLNAGLVAWLVVILVSAAPFTSGFFWYLLFSGALNLGYIVISIIALVHARKGRFYYIPLFGRLAFSRFYGPKAEARGKTASWENRPPEGI
jgi:uncharacterized membrane protein